MEPPSSLNLSQLKLRERIAHIAKKPRTASRRPPIVPSLTALPGEAAGTAVVLIYADPLVSSLFRLGIIHDLLDFGGQSVEGLVHVDVVLG